MSDAAKQSELDEFYYSRDHDRGPGAWCVRGPQNFHCIVGDKTCAYILAKALSGLTSDAAHMARDIARMYGCARE